MNENLESVCKSVVEAYPKQVQNYRQGKTAFGFLIGMVVKRMNGQLDHPEAVKILRGLLDNA